MRTPLAGIGLSLGACIGTACGSGEAPRPQSKAAVAAHTVASTKDASIGGVRRFQVKVSLPQYYDRGTVEGIAKAVVADMTAVQPVNAISILFYGPGTSMAGIYDVAMVDWAPNGQWGDATSVKAGDYGSFSYSVKYNPPSPAILPAQTAALPLSGESGLLGAPLPGDATLVDKRAADENRDARERYRISASAAEITNFFNTQMPAAGWSKDGASTPRALFFRKGKHNLAVLINGDGKSFTLMGS